jgi:hypothetical protein
MSVAEAQQRISSSEFAEWRAYDLREPIGPERQEMMAAIVATTVANFSGRTKKNLKPKDFLPTYGPPKRQDPADMLNRLKLAARLGAEAKRIKAERSAKIAEKKAAKAAKKK